MAIDLLASAKKIEVDETLTVEAILSGPYEIESFEWKYDDGALDTVSEGSGMLAVSPFLTGSYTISYTAHFTDGSKTTQAIIFEAVLPGQVIEEEVIVEEPVIEDDYYHGMAEELKLSQPFNDNYDLPNIMKRNARYRGQRESEKHLHDHQEQIFDIRQNFKQIEAFTNLQERIVKGWFHGEEEIPYKNLMISDSKIFSIAPNQSVFTLIEGMVVRSFSEVVVQLDGVIVDSSKYTIQNNELIIDTTTATANTSPTTLRVAFKADVLVPQSYITGIYSLKERLQGMDERLKEVERRYRYYENAYE